jgi:NAD(P)-dependent dehydrogenase (short-subunit alcohol dehydrogenase family)
LRLSRCLLPFTWSRLIGWAYAGHLLFILCAGGSINPASFPAYMIGDFARLFISVGLFHNGHLPYLSFPIILCQTFRQKQCAFHNFAGLLYNKKRKMILSFSGKGCVRMRKVAMITGAGQGIGRALALRFSQEGYAVSLADTEKEAGQEVIRHIRQYGGSAMFMNVDVADEEAVNRWVRLTHEDMGQIDVLVNNAGIMKNAPMLELSLADFDRVLAVNLRGTFICSQLAAKVMRRGDGGSIINIASTRGLMSEANTEAYSASKGGILALTHAMAVSLGGYGIRVNAISPGWIEVGDWQYSPRAVVPKHSERDKSQHPAGRVGTPEDITNACIFLASNQSSGFITGQNIVIDGGMTVKMIYEE